ncbi:MAG: hypothetical protein HYZ92_00715 [Candidatus Omnitrophica bacterium]|nr:hypothetical protein [Candidatus Omnitrophota bacterium]
MEKIKQSRIESLPPVVLYRDDLEELVEILKEGCGQIEIVTDTFRLAAEELATLQEERIRSIRFETHNPSLTLSFQHFQANLLVLDNDPVSEGIVYKIKECLRSRRRALWWLLTPWGTWTLGIPLNILLIFGRSISLVVSFSLLGIGIGAFLWGFREGTTRYSVIGLGRKNQVPSFWEKNRDSIILMFFSALVGALVTEVIRRLFKH